MMKVKSLNFSMSYFHFMECAYKTSDYAYLSAFREALISIKDPDCYKFMITVICKKFPFTNATYIALKSTLETCMRQKLFNTLISVYGLVVQSTFKKVTQILEKHTKTEKLENSETPESLDINFLFPNLIDLVSFFVLGFQVHSNYYIDCGKVENSGFKPMEKFLNKFIVKTVCGEGESPTYAFN